MARFEGCFFYLIVIYNIFIKIEYRKEIGMFKSRIHLSAKDVGKIIVVLFFVFVIGTSSFMYFSTHESKPSYVSVEQ